MREKKREQLCISESLSFRDLSYCDSNCQYITRKYELYTSWERTLRFQNIDFVYASTLSTPYRLYTGIDMTRTTEGNGREREREGWC